MLWWLAEVKANFYIWALPIDDSFSSFLGSVEVHRTCHTLVLSSLTRIAHWKDGSLGTGADRSLYLSIGRALACISEH